MNKKMIGKLVGVLFFLEALFMLPAIAVCFVYGDTGADYSHSDVPYGAESRGMRV